MLLQGGKVQVYIIQPSEKEVFVDCGVFVGDAIRDFYKRICGRYNRVIAFEPDTYNFGGLTKLKHPNVIKINTGLWNENEELHFTNGEDVAVRCPRMLQLW